MKRIYLAGGMVGDWRKKITESKLLGSVNIRNRFKFYDPTKHTLSDSYAYTYWDLQAIRNSDIIVGFMEASNPSGYGLNLELGYAKALEKTIVLLIEPEFAQDYVRARYFAMAVSISDVVLSTFEDVNKFLDQLERID